MKWLNYPNDFDYVKIFVVNENFLNENFLKSESCCVRLQNKYKVYFLCEKIYLLFLCKKIKYEKNKDKLLNIRLDISSKVLNEH